MIIILSIFLIILDEVKLGLMFLVYILKLYLKLMLFYLWNSSWLFLIFFIFSFSSKLISMFFHFWLELMDLDLFDVISKFFFYIAFSSSYISCRWFFVNWNSGSVFSSQQFSRSFLSRMYLNSFLVRLCNGFYFHKHFNTYDFYLESIGV